MTHWSKELDTLLDKLHVTSDKDRRATHGVIRECYSEPHRHYHGFRHIEQCLDEFSHVSHLCEEPLAVEMAIFFHDAIYNPMAKAGQNEDGSVGIVIKVLRYLGFLKDYPYFSAGVQIFILCTDHSDKPPDFNDGKIIHDIDLTVLGHDMPEYIEYISEVRKEYSHISDDVFYIERDKLMKTFLDRPRIYLTDYFFEKYEQQARHNIRRVNANFWGYEGSPIRRH